MINIFNLFLLLLAIWGVCVYTLFGVNYIYFGLGVVISLMISLVCFHLKIINKKSELLYLSVGFHQFFIGLYLSNIVKQIIVQIKILLLPSFVDPKTIKLNLSSSENQENIALLVAALNFMAGYMVLKVESNYIVISAINADYKKNFRPKKILKKIKNINDDSLI